MSVFKDNNGLWGVKVTHNDKEYVTHGFKTRAEARTANAQLTVSVDDAGDYEPDYEQVDESLVTKMINRFKKRKAEKALDKETRKQLENM